MVIGVFRLALVGPGIRHVVWMAMDGRWTVMWGRTQLMLVVSEKVTSSYDVTY